MLNLCVHTYSEVRSICHLVKEGIAGVDILNQIAFETKRFIPNNSVIIPIPSHIGYATYTLDIALRMGVQVLDCIECEPHQSLYTLKKQGIKVSPAYLKFRLKSGVTLPKNNVYLFDLVFATGTTEKAAQALFDFPLPMLVYAYDDKILM